MKIRTYSELIMLPTFKLRFEYLNVHSQIGYKTFGYDRFINQDFYHSKEWELIKDYIIVRDCGCDLGIKGREIVGNVYVHHMNPLSVEDFKTGSKFLLDPEYLISSTHITHNAIHYGSYESLPTELIERRPNDTCPWKISS